MYMRMDWGELTLAHSNPTDRPTHQGMIIDAGSTGSRMHVYQWDARRFRDVPPPFSYPLTSNRWTDRLAYVCLSISQIRMPLHIGM